MKALLFILLCAVGGFYAYKHFVDVPVPTPTPTPTPRLAPPGVFFTKERFSEKTKFGVRALKAGSQVKLLNQDETTSVVIDDNSNEFKVPTEILTNDLDVRDALLKKIADENAKFRPSGSLDNSARDARIASLKTEITRQELRLEELRLARSRAQEVLDVEAAKTKQSSISGAPMRGEEVARRNIKQIDAQIKGAQRKIEDASLAIKKEQFGEKPLPYKPARP